MSTPENQQDDAAVDALMRERFGMVGQLDDPSGLLGSDALPGPAELDEDAQFEAYMARYFPRAAGSLP